MASVMRKSSPPNRRMKHAALSAQKRLDPSFEGTTKADKCMSGYRAEEREQIVELLRILSEKPRRFRLQFLNDPDQSDAMARDETDIWAPDPSTAVRMANDALLQAEACGVRVTGPDGSTIYESEKAALCTA